MEANPGREWHLREGEAAMSANSIAFRTVTLGIWWLCFKD
jgi:hypothetical protein